MSRLKVSEKPAKKPPHTVQHTVPDSYMRAWCDRATSNGAFTNSTHRVMLHDVQVHREQFSLDLIDVTRLREEHFGDDSTVSGPGGLSEYLQRFRETRSSTWPFG